MARWPWPVTLRVRALATAGRIRFTNKAQHEIEALALGLDRNDARDVLSALTPNDAGERIWSFPAGERLYVYFPLVAGERLYVKLALRGSCVVISFHREDDHREEHE